MCFGATSTSQVSVAEELLPLNVGKTENLDHFIHIPLLFAKISSTLALVWTLFFVKWKKKIDHFPKTENDHNVHILRGDKKVERLLSRFSPVCDAKHVNDQSTVDETMSN